MDITKKNAIIGFILIVVIVLSFIIIPILINTGQLLQSQKEYTNDKINQDMPDRVEYLKATGISYENNTIEEVRLMTARAQGSNTIDMKKVKFVISKQQNLYNEINASEVRLDNTQDANNFVLRNSNSFVTITIDLDKDIESGFKLNEGESIIIETHTEYGDITIIELYAPDNIEPNSEFDF
jgi:archaellin